MVTIADVNMEGAHELCTGPWRGHEDRVQSEYSCKKFVSQRGMRFTDYFTVQGITCRRHAQVQAVVAAGCVSMLRANSAYPQTEHR